LIAGDENLMVSLKKSSIGSHVFDCVNIVLLVAMSLICVIPFLFVIAASFSSPDQLIKYNFVLWPKGFTLNSYKYLLYGSNAVVNGLKVSAFMTVLATAVNLAVTSLMAYPLSHSDVFGYKVIIRLVTITLVFSGGMIPTYIVISKLNLLNSYWSIILPTAVDAFSLIIFISFFRAIPRELEEAAKIDGYNDFQIFLKIILPTSTPLLATFTLMFAVMHWNEWFNYVLYINNSAMWSIQVILRTMTDSANSSIGNSLMLGESYTPPQDVVRYCVIVIATLPIMIVYPFLQKYFTKGMMIGSVKG
jgi:putative aldouronate transport system permease protein